MTASESIKQFIRRHEGLRLHTYVCPGGVPTIGYGHTGPDVTSGLRITHTQALALFEADVAEFEHSLNAALARDGIRLSRQGQFDALLSFAYNVGISALGRSTLWRKIKANADDPTIPNEFGRWVYARGKRLPGLVKRRQEEAAIWQR